MDAKVAKVAKLIQRCITDVSRRPVDNVSLYLGDDILVWYLALHYPKEAPFVGGSAGSLTAFDFTLYVTLQFPEDFPARPPRLKFLSPWINHQHLWGDRICHSLLTDDFADFFTERRTHGTSLWNASCALADSEGIGGMPRYLQILREYLASDLDYDEEQHVKYDEESLQRDVKVQREFLPDFFHTACILEPSGGPLKASRDASGGYSCKKDDIPEAPKSSAEPWGTDFFLKSALVPGDPECHPCFDVAITGSPGRPPMLSTAMTTLCKTSFEMGARKSDFGSSIAVVLPYPCSRSAWETSGSMLAASALVELSPVTEWYQVQLPGIEEDAEQKEAILNVVGELWRSTCISIIKDEGYESERAMMCFVTLHFLLLCLAKEIPDLKSHAVVTVKEFMQLIETEPEWNLKESVPDLGRFLVRFLLAEDEAPLQKNSTAIVREFLSRNVRWVPFPMWPTKAAPEDKRKEQTQASFEAGNFGMKLIIFQCYYILRSAELGLDNLDSLEACQGRPSADVLQHFQKDYKLIKGLTGFVEFFRWLHLDDLTDMDLHNMLCEAVDESEARGYNAGVRGR